MCPNKWYINFSQLTVVAGEEGLPVLTDFPSSLFPMRQSPKEKHLLKYAPTSYSAVFKEAMLLSARKCYKDQNIINQVYNIIFYS